MRVLFIHSFSPKKSSSCIADAEERDVAEKDEDDGGAIVRFATLQSRLENKQSLRNWLTIKALCLQNKKISKAPFALATLI